MNNPWNKSVWIFLGLLLFALLDDACRLVDGYHFQLPGRHLLPRAIHPTKHYPSASSGLQHKSVLPVRRDLLSHRLFGVPRLFRWLVNLYPDMLQSGHLVNFRPKEVKPLSLSQNFGPKGKTAKSTVDNFYLDMNGIIHTCTHGNNQGGLVKHNEREMFRAIFAYTDNLIKYVKPQNKLVLAIDGVAPKAKRNQQRARRFRAAIDRNELIQAFIEREGRLPAAIDAFDSSCITPGTPFMHRLSVAFRSWIGYKRSTDNFWIQSPAEIVYSGADVPGEGEHKIMDMIRADTLANTKSQELVHCMYGQDADLIMLSLVTHKRFFLLREKVYFARKNGTTIPHQAGHHGFRAGAFEILDIDTVRSMLNSYFEPVKSSFNSSLHSHKKSRKGSSSSSSSTHVASVNSPATSVHPAWFDSKVNMTGNRAESIYNLDRIVDDFVLLSFLVGNDFVPGLPHFDISDGCMELIMDSYHKLLPSLGGYITDKSAIHLSRLELVLSELSRRERLFFQHRAISDDIPEYDSEEYKHYYYMVTTKYTVSLCNNISVYRVNSTLAMIIKRQ
jgi:5'-3' exoribonuclease 1